MKRLANLFSVAAILSFVVLGTAGLADAQRRNERLVRDLVRTLNAQIDDFQYGLDYHLRSTSSGGAVDIEGVHENIRNLQTKVDDLDENLNNRRDNEDDIHEIVAAAMDVHMFLKINPQNRRIDANWQNVRTTINNLAAIYGVKPDWNVTDYSSTTTRSSDNQVRIIRPGDPIANPRATAQRPDSMGNPRRTGQPRDPVVTSDLTGTYTIDKARSENIADIISTSGVGSAHRQDLQTKLEAPEQVAIDVRGNQVTLASSKAPPVSFVADGRDKTEQSNGKTVRLRATLRGDDLTITSLGGESDYTVTFAPLNGGRTLKITRRITTEYLNETLFAESFYNKTEDYAGLGIARNNPGNADDDISSSNDPNPSSNDPNSSSSDSDDRYSSNDRNPSIAQGRTGEFIVPSGMIVTGFLESSIDTKVTQNNDRFKLTVQSPNDFRGATIEGYLTGVGRSGQVSGRSNVTFNFERITLRNGKSYDFAGYLQSIKDQNGKDVKIDSEGTAKGGNQTTKTAKRGGIGAGIGAIIGAIAGGGTGAAIGAIIGGGAGAGSVVVQGREDLKLMKGSMITIQSSSPAGTTSRVTDNN